MADPTISVVIPCYNAAPYIGDCLRSVAQQTAPPTEIVVVDDGSTDGSLNAIRQSGVPVTLIQTDRANGAGARNAGIDAASGEWIAFQDADDLWLPNHLERAASMLCVAADVAYLGHRYYFDSANPAKLSTLPFRHFPTTPRSGIKAEQFLEWFSHERRYSMSSTVIRKDRLTSVGKLNTAFRRRHDIEMWLRVIAGSTWSFDPEPSTCYRRDTPGSISRAAANAELYFFRVLIENRDRYPGPTIDRMLRRTARSAMASALTEGTPDEIREAYSVVSGWFGARDRLIFSIACRLPGFSQLNRLRRSWMSSSRTHTDA